MKFKAGDKVRIVNKTEMWNEDGHMDKWLGTIMTIGKVGKGGYYFMKEDRGQWFWPEESLEKVETRKQKIIIESDGKVVTATMPGVSETGVAKCHPDDEFDFKYGAKLAIERLFDSIAEIKVGDIVEAIDTGKQYTTYTDWVLKNVKNTDDTMRFDYGNDMELGAKYRVIKIAPHSSSLSLDTLMYVEEVGRSKHTTHRCYLISSKGLKRV